MFFRKLCVLLSFSLISLSVYAQLPSVLKQALVSARMPIGGWSAIVVPVNQAKPILQVNLRRLRSPASVTKLVTSMAALDILGPAFYWKTRFWKKGNTLYIKGGGDPHLVLENLWLILQNLRGRSVKRVDHIVVDTSYFKVGKPDLKDDKEVRRAYLARPYPFLVNFNAVNLTFIPKVAEKKVLVQASPDFTGLAVRPPALSFGSCGNWREKIRVRSMQLPTTLYFNGIYSAKCGERNMTLRAYPLNNRQYFQYLFRTLWPQLGGVGLPDVVEGAIPTDARFIYSYASQPLSEQLRYMNKYSNNVMAQHIFLSLSAQKGTGDAAKSRIAIYAWLDKLKIGTNSTVFSNGSGLTRENRFTVLALAKLLKRMWFSPNMPDFVASLPQEGIDGSMKKRLDRPPYKGSGYIKTGRLNNVSSIAGYMQSAKGRRYIVVSILNAKGAEYAQSVHDALLRWVYRLP